MSDLQEPSKPRRAASRGLRIAFAISLTLNLLVAGLVVGAWIGGDRDRRPDTALSDIGFGPFIAALPGSERRAIGVALIERAGSLRQNREELRQQFEVMLAALRAEPFEIAAVRQAIEAQQQRLNERQEIGEALLYARIEAMSGAERAAFADALEQGLRRGPRFRRDGPGHDD